MDRAYSSGAAGSAPSAPASPSIGYPTAGNPGVGTPPTKPGPYWYHMITEELMSILAAAGITPAQGTLTQLLTALRSAGVFQTQATNDKSTKVATTAFANPGSSLAANGYQKLPSGLIIQWGMAGTGFGTASRPLNITFPIAFPNACFAITSKIGVNSSDYDASPSYRSSRQDISFGDPTLTGCEGQAFLDTNISDGRSVSWIAIGY